MKLFLVDQGNLKEISKPIFSMGDVYVVDDDKTIYIWIGSKASVDEKPRGLHKLVRSTNNGVELLK
jgi:hypothetical protein